VLEAVFVLLEFPSPSRRIFIGSHSLPPSVVRRIGPSPGETDATVAAEKQEAFGMIRQAMEEIMARHNTAFLNSFRQMMVGVFAPSVDKHFEQGESSATAAGQPPRQDASVQPPQQSMSVQPTQHVDSQPIRQNPHQAVPNPRTYGEMAFALLEFNLSLPIG
jgi:hypothetical protein